MGLEILDLFLADKLSFVLFVLFVLFSCNTLSDSDLLIFD